MGYLAEMSVRRNRTSGLESAKVDSVETLKQGELEKEPLLRKARWFSDRNRTYKAVQCYLKVLKKHPGSLAVIQELTMQYLDRSDYEMAIVCLNYLCSQKPRSLDLKLKLIHAYMNVGNYHKAYAELISQEDWAEHFNEERLLSLSQCELHLGNTFAAISRLYELCNRTNSPVYFLFLAETLEAQNYIDEAMQVTRKGLKREPYFEELLVLKGRLHLCLEEYSKAQSLYQKMIKNQMYMGEVAYDVDDALSQKGQLPELLAIQKFLEDFPVEIDPTQD